MIAQTANILHYLGPRLGLAPDAESARLWLHQLQLTVEDLVLDIHDTHHPIAMSLYYEDQKAESKRRAEYFKNHLSRVNRSNLARMHMQNAQKAYDRGDLFKAERQVNDALRHSKNDLDALRLRDQIRTALDERKRKWFRMPFTLNESNSVESGQ